MVDLPGQILLSAEFSAGAPALRGEVIGREDDILDYLFPLPLRRQRQRLLEAAVQDPWARLCARRPRTAEVLASRGLRRLEGLPGETLCVGVGFI